MKECCKDYLMEQFGDEFVAEEIYGEFVASMKTKVEEVSAALAAQDWHQVDLVAHAIKGNSLAAGDEEMAETAIALRNEAKLHEPQRSAVLVEKLKELVAGL